MRQLWIILVALVAVGMSAGMAIAQNPHFVGEPTCTLSDSCTTVACSGKIAGVGNTPTDVTVDIPNSGCVNNPGHEPPGHAQAGTGPITPKGGSITFRVSVTLSCPPGLTPVFGDEAFIFVTPVGGQSTEVDGPVPISKPDTCL